MQKHSAHRLTYVLNEIRQLIDVDNVPTGNKCGCSCPACKEPLIAKNQGEKQIHHFIKISESFLYSCSSV